MNAVSAFEKAVDALRGAELHTLSDQEVSRLLLCVERAVDAVYQEGLRRDPNLSSASITIASDRVRSMTRRDIDEIADRLIPEVMRRMGE